MAYNPYLQNPYLQPAYMQGYHPMLQQQPVIQQPQQTPQQPQSNVIWVNSETEARNYPVAAGNTVMLMDNDHPVAYKKASDLSGRALPLEVYDLVKRDQEPPKEENHQINLDEYLTRKEFDSYASAIDKRISEISISDDEEDYEDDEEEIEEVKPVKRTRRAKK